MRIGKKALGVLQKYRSCDATVKKEGDSTKMLANYWAVSCAQLKFIKLHNTHEETQLLCVHAFIHTWMF